MKTSIVVAALLSGCSLVDPALDEVGDALVDEVQSYCSSPLYRREALNILVNGRLEQIQARITIICPGE